MTAIEADDRKALQSLLGWWADAGVDPDLAPEETRPAPRAFERRPPPAPTPRARPAPPPATAAAARAAGFGGADADPSDARKLAGAAKTLDELKAALEAFDGCALKRTARSTVFARGNPEAAVMVVGEAPGREEDEQGLPFVGRSGQLLDRMFRAIGLDPGRDLYVSNIVNWRPPGNRNPTQEETALCLPFIERHVALARPKVLVLAGGVPAQALLRASTGIMRLRGRWADYRIKDADFQPADHIPALPIFHPAFLLRRPMEKRAAWRDLLMLQKKLEAPG
ncbi:MAG: uracil-DNA glycosylase [Maricaulaceae bacterium]|nr:uracil-DNA glycosylase [Maricaulaceae bacterium]